MPANSFCIDSDSEDRRNEVYFRSFRTMHSSHKLRDDQGRRVGGTFWVTRISTWPRMFTARASGKSERMLWPKLPKT